MKHHEPVSLLNFAARTALDLTGAEFCGFALLEERGALWFPAKQVRATSHFPSAFDQQDVLLIQKAISNQRIERNGAKYSAPIRSNDQIVGAIFLHFGFALDSDIAVDHEPVDTFLELLGAALNGVSRSQNQEFIGSSELDVDNWFARVYKSSPSVIGIARLSDRTLVEVNPAFSNVFEYSREEALGDPSVLRSLWSVPSKFDALIDDIHHNHHVETQYFDFRTKTGQHIFGNCTSDTFTVNGEKHFLFIFCDMTHQEEIERSRRESEARYRTIIENGSMGITLRQNNKMLLVNNALAEITGYSVEEFMNASLEDVMNWVHQDDRQAFYERQLDSVIGEEAPARFQFRFIHKTTGNDVWVDVVFHNVPHEGQKAQLGIYMNISEQKVMENELRQSEEKFRQLISASPDAVIGLNLDGEIAFANQETTNLLGYKIEEIIGKKVDMILPMYEINRQTDDRDGYVASPSVRWMGMGLDLCVIDKLGREIPVDIKLSYTNIDGGVLVIAYMRDITKRRNAESKLIDAYAQLRTQVGKIEELQLVLREQAVRDPLTGLHNRRFLNETLGLELARAARENYPVCFVMVDIDNFKLTNDKLGHLVGDSVLRNLALQLQNQTRAGDIVCRYGGEEFLIILPNVTSVYAVQAADRWRETFESAVVIEDGAEVRSTISCGVSEYPVDGRTGSEIIYAADRALYHAKRNGKNRVSVWSKIKNLDIDVD